jgi:dCTP diphosphatase
MIGSTPWALVVTEAEPSLSDLQLQLAEFAKRRGWDKLRTLKDVSLALGIEVGELQELLLWVPPGEEQAVIEEHREELESEAADILIYLLALTEMADIDLLAATKAKIARNEERFPEA